MLEIYIGENGNWYIDGKDTGKPSRGRDGRSAYEIATDLGYQGTMSDWVDDLKGAAGTTPHIGENGNWMIGDEDTGILADVQKIVEDKISEELKSIKENLIIETGSNENGRYRKHADGTLEMWGVKALTDVSVKRAIGGAYISEGKLLTLPYKSTTSVKGISLAFRSNTGAWAAVSTAGDNKTNLGYWLWSGTSTIVAGGLSFWCIGTWK